MASDSKSSWVSILRARVIEVCYHVQLSVLLPPRLVTETIHLTTEKSYREYLFQLQRRHRRGWYSIIRAMTEAGAKGMDPGGGRMHSVREHTQNLSLELGPEEVTRVTK